MAAMKILLVYIREVKAYESEIPKDLQMELLVDCAQGSD